MNVRDVQRWNTEHKDSLFNWRNYNLKSIKGTIRSQTLIKSEGEDSENVVILALGFNHYVLFALVIWTTFIFLPI